MRQPRVRTKAKVRELVFRDIGPGVHHGCGVPFHASERGSSTSRLATRIGRSAFGIHQLQEWRLETYSAKEPRGTSNEAFREIGAGESRTIESSSSSSLTSGV